jgi:hypothetical protein
MKKALSNIRTVTIEYVYYQKPMRVIGFWYYSFRSWSAH